MSQPDPSPPPTPGPQRFLFLQGPVSPFFTELAARLLALGHAVERVNLSGGDRLFWRLPGATDFTGPPADWPGFIAALLAARHITTLVLLGEQRPYHRVAIAAARARGVAVVATDFGYLRPDWISFEQDGLGGDSRFPRDPAAIRRLAAGLPRPDLAPAFGDSFARRAAWDMAYHLASGLSWRFRRYRTHLPHHPLRTYLGLGRRLLRRGAEARAAAAVLAGLPGAGPRFLFAMQLETDYAIRAYSPYAGMAQPLAEVVRSFAAHAPAGAQLLVKQHPLAPAGGGWPRRVAALAAAAGVAGRVHYLGGGPLEAMLPGMRGVVTVNSTAGLAAVLQGCPTLALGRAIYAVPGLAWLGGLDRFWQEAPPPDAALAEAFLCALAGTVQIRGGFYAPPGRRAAAAAAARRLHLGLVNAPLPAAGD